MRKKNYHAPYMLHVLRFGRVRRMSRRRRSGLAVSAALVISLLVYASGIVPESTGSPGIDVIRISDTGTADTITGNAGIAGGFFLSDTVLSPAHSEGRAVTYAAEAIRAAAAQYVPDDIIIEGYPVNSDEQLDIGGELASGADSDIQQALPANVRLDRITIDAEVTKPLSSARVSSFFGFRKNPVTGKYTFHKGLDLAAPGGTEIHAMYSGKVTTASYDNGYGNYVIIDHGGFQTLYAHCSKLKCSAGDRVSAGTVIALVGSTGNSTGNHLHVEFRRDGQRYDPEWILGGIYS